MRLPPGLLTVASVTPLGTATLATLGICLLAADLLPENRYLDVDYLEYTLSVSLGGAVLYMALQDRLAAAELRRLRHRVLLSIVTLATATVAAEFTTRWLYRDVTTSANTGSYFTRRWLRTGPIQMNPAGFRGPTYSDAKRPGVYRIAVVGDSFTFGNGVRQQDRYTELMQTRLPAHLEVLNFGAGGANTPQHYARVVRVLGEVQPDFILLQWYVNDMEDDDTTGRPEFRSLVPFRSLHHWLSRRSALYDVANVPWAELQVALGVTRSYPEYLFTRLGDPNGNDALIDKRFLMGIIDACRTARVPLGVVLFPDTEMPIDDTYRFAYLHDRVLNTCAERELSCVDLREDFAQVKDHRTLWASRLDHHPSARANAIAAERILHTFAATWVASAPK